MQVEAGAILEGKVTGITSFGAFVELPGGQTGMVHISEVAPTFVTDIRQHLQENQEVKVKVLNVGEDGKISLSIKRAMDPGTAPRGGGNRAPRDGARGGAPRGNSRPRTPRQPAVSPGRPGSFEWQNASAGTTFEDMMSHFKQTSDEKISDLKRSSEGRHGGYSRRGGNRGGNGGGMDF